MSSIIAGIDIKPLPDGTVRFTFDGTADLVDRLAVWNVSAEEFEDDEREDEGLDEADARDLARVIEEPPLVVPAPRTASTVIFEGAAPRIVFDEVTQHRINREIRTTCAKLLVDLKAGALPPSAPLPPTFAAVFEVRHIEAA